MKKILSVVLVVCFLFNGTITYAASTNSSSIQPNSYSQAEITQIEKERQMLYDDLKAQLEAQNALDKIDQFSFLVENTINAKYFKSSNITTRALYWYAPNGGWFKGTGTNFEGEAQFCTAAQAQKLYNKRASSEQEILKYLGSIFVSEIFSRYAYFLTGRELANTISKNVMWKRIKVGKDPVVIYSTFDTQDERTTTVLWKWNDYPYMDSSSFGMDTITKHGIG